MTILRKKLRHETFGEARGVGEQTLGGTLSNLQSITKLYYLSIGTLHFLPPHSNWTSPRDPSKIDPRNTSRTTEALLWSDTLRIKSSLAAALNCSASFFICSAHLNNASSSSWMTINNCWFLFEHMKMEFWKSNYLIQSKGPFWVASLCRVLIAFFQ